MHIIDSYKTKGRIAPLLLFKHKKALKMAFSLSFVLESSLQMQRGKKVVAHGLRYNGVCDDIMNIGGSQCATTPILP